MSKPKHQLLSRLLASVALTAAVALAVPLGVRAEIVEGSERVSIAVTDRVGRELPPEGETTLRVFVDEERSPSAEASGDRRPSHRRRAVTTCQPTTDDTRETFGLTGWHLPSGPFPFVVNVERAPEAVRAAAPEVLGATAATWGSVGPDRQLVFAGETLVSRPRYDGTNAVLWRRLPRGTVAAAYVWYHPATRAVLDADIVFNARVPWAVNDPALGDCGGDPTAYDLLAVALHEFGHWLGLEDLYDFLDVDLTMYGIVVLGELKKATLGHGDILGAQAVAP